MLTNLALVMAKVESSYGVDPTPAPATDAILVGNLGIRVDAKMIDRAVLKPTLSRLASTVGRKLIEFTFFTELKASGTAGTAPRHGALWKMAGFSETISAGVSVTYAPINSSFQSGTIWAYLDGILIKSNGGFATARIIEPVGEFGRIEWTFRGTYASVTDAAIPGSITYDTTKPQPVQNLALTMGGYSAIAANLSIDCGVTISERPDLNAANGLKGLQITQRAAGGSIDPEAVTEATNPFWANFAAGTEVALAGNTVGGTAGNKVQITAPKLQSEAPQLGDRNGTRIYQLPFRLNPTTDSASDELQIQYT